MAKIYKTFADYAAHILENPEHPAHHAMRSTYLKEMRERDPRLRATQPTHVNGRAGLSGQR